MKIEVTEAVSALRLQGVKLRTFLTTQLETVASLMEWTCQSVPYGWNPQPITHNGTATDILRKVRRGARFVCGTHQRLFTELCGLGGLETREITVIRAGCETVDPGEPWSWFTRHQVAEVNLLSLLYHEPPPGSFKPAPPSYLPSRWVLFDPTNNQYFLDPVTRMPLSALQVHRAWATRGENKVPATITILQGSYRPPIPAQPAYGMRDGEWREIVSAEDVQRIFTELGEIHHLLYYDHVFYRPNLRQRITVGVTDEATPEIHQHWNAPLEGTIGRYEYTAAPDQDLYR